MFTFLAAILAQCLTFIPMALAVYLSFCILKVTDLTLDGSFILGAAIFAKLTDLNFNPYAAAIASLLGGALTGLGVSLMQRQQKIDSLLAGVLATFILVSGNLILMGQPNINLLNKVTMFSTAFSQNELHGYFLVALYVASFSFLILLLLKSRLGLVLRGFGDNQNLLQRIGKPIELYRMIGFAITNLLAAASGCLTAQTIGYADIGMGVGMTLTALGAVILGKQITNAFNKKPQFIISIEFLSCFIGVIIYFLALNGLLRLDINPIYLKMLLGLTLIFFLRAAKIKKSEDEI